MKKLLIILLLAPFAAKSQSLDTVSVSLTLRAGDWAWSIGKYGEGNDSASRVKIRQIRAAIIAANPPGFQTQVTINNITGKVLLAIYRQYVQAHHGETLQLTNTLIYTNIRAISNTAVQYFITQLDEAAQEDFLRTRTNGKNILMDN